MVRYDTPTIKGFGGWAEWGQGPEWETVLTYGDPATLEDVQDDEEGDDDDKPKAPPLIKGFQIAAAVGYQGVNDDEDLPNYRDVAGSISILHEASGFSLTVAGGQRFFTESVELNNGDPGKPQDAAFYYIKPSLRLKMIKAGHTAFYAEHGLWRNFLGSNTDAEDVAGLSGLTEQDVCLDGNACLVASSRARIWGVGAVQHIDRAVMDLYIGFRRYEADVGLVDGQGRRLSPAGLTNFTTVMSGAYIDF
jgi:hypothetical protein